MSNLPQWARKPAHKKEVVATPRGWMVKETGEYLKLVRDLDQRLKELKKEAEEVSVSGYEPSEPEAVSTPVVEPETPEKETQGEEKTVSEEPKPKRRGRPRKQKNEDS